MVMACITLFLLVFATTSKAASISSHNCNVNTPPLSTSSDDVDMTNLSQVNTSLQYCMIDYCTIMRIDTGEELQIIHTTESLLVATPTDGHTYKLVLPLQKGLQCFSVSTEGGKLVTGVLVSFSTTLGSMSTYLVLVHLSFPELRTVLGILLMSYNAVEVVVHLFALPLYLMYNSVALGSQLICQAVFNMFMLSTMAAESYATCILFHITFMMYRSCKLKSGMPKSLLYRYNCSVFGLIVVFAVIIIGYDLYSGNGKHTILPSGYCIFIGDRSYQTRRISDVYNTGHKVIQMSLFVIFLFYYYKERNTISPAPEDNNNMNPTRMSKQLFMIAAVMGTCAGIVLSIWITASILAPNYAYTTTTIGLLPLLLQQCVVMVSFMFTQKMSRLCYECFYP